MQDLLKTLKSSGPEINTDVAKAQFPHFFRTYPGLSIGLSNIHRAWLLWYTVFVRNKCLRKWNAKPNEIVGLTTLMNKLMAPTTTAEQNDFVWGLDGDPDHEDQNAFERVVNDIAPSLRDMNVTRVSTAEIYDDFCRLSEPKMLYLFCRMLGSKPLRCEYARLSRKY